MFCKYWNFCCSGSEKEHFLRHTPYLHCATIISLLKNGFAFYFDNSESPSHNDDLNQV